MIEKGEKILTAFAEYAKGPGWANEPLWVVVEGKNDQLRLECIQPEDQTTIMRCLFRVSSVAHEEMTRAIRVWSENEPWKSLEK